MHASLTDLEDSYLQKYDGYSPITLHHQRTLLEQLVSKIWLHYDRSLQSCSGGWMLILYSACTCIYTLCTEGGQWSCKKAYLLKYDRYSPVHLGNQRAMSDPRMDKIWMHYDSWLQRYWADGWVLRHSAYIYTWRRRQVVQKKSHLRKYDVHIPGHLGNQ